MSTEIVNKEEARQLVRQTNVVGITHSLAEVIEIAKTMAASGFFGDIKSAQQAAAVMIIGAQYGISPAQSLTAIHIVKGKPMLHYSLILAKIREHPDYDYKITENTDEVAEVEFLRHDAICGRERFTIQQARRQQTGNLDKFPDTMLLARAISKGVKKFCPDVLNGMPTYVQGEIEEAGYGYAPDKTKGDALREEMQAKALELSNPVAPAESKDEGPFLDDHELTDEQVDELADALLAFNLTDAQVHDFEVMAEQVGANLNQVALGCEVKTAEALESALSQGSLL